MKHKKQLRKMSEDKQGSQQSTQGSSIATRDGSPAPRAIAQHFQSADNQHRVDTTLGK
jgi:hypothetical protein